MTGYEKRAKLSVWAKRHGLTPRSARQMVSFGTLPAVLDPVKIERHWFVLEADGARLRTVLYARVSSADQWADLDRQKLRLLEHAQKQGIRVLGGVRPAGSSPGWHQRSAV